MQKLVFVHSWGDEGCCGTSHIAFEYESKDKFCYDALEKLETWKKENKLIGRKDNYQEYHWAVINIFNDYFSPCEIENLEYNIFTLEEWFEKEKETKIFK